MCTYNTNSISGVYYILNDVRIPEFGRRAVKFDRISLTSSTVFGLLVDVERFGLHLYADKNIKDTLNKQQRMIYKIYNEI